MLDGKILKLPTFKKACESLYRRVKTGYYNTDSIQGMPGDLWDQIFSASPIQIRARFSRQLNGNLKLMYNVSSLKQAFAWDFDKEILEIIVNAKTMPKNFKGETEGVDGYGIQ